LNNNSRTDLNNSRKGSNSRGSSHSKKNNNVKNTSTAGLIAAQKTIGTAGDANNSRVPRAETLATAGKPEKLSRKNYSNRRGRSSTRDNWNIRTHQQQGCQNR
jgi:hypothetical protein